MSRALLIFAAALLLLLSFSVDEVKCGESTRSESGDVPAKVSSTYCGSTPPAPDWDYYDIIELRKLWKEFGSYGDGIVIAVLDGGVDINHPALAGKFADDPAHDGGWSEWKDVGGQVQRIPSSPYDPDGHGTAVTSLLVGGHFGGVDVGVAPEAKFIHAKVVDDPDEGGDPRGEDVTAAAIEWAAVQGGADVIVMSIEFNHNHPAGNVNTAINNVLVNYGVICVAAVGNNRSNEDECYEGDLNGSANAGVPAKSQNCIAVGAVRRSDYWENPYPPAVEYLVAWNHSAGGRYQYGTQVYNKPEVVAPHDNILVADINNCWAFRNGTSVSAPIVGGVVALMLSASSNLRDAPGDIKHKAIRTGLIKGVAVPYWHCGSAPPYYPQHALPNTSLGWGISLSYSAVSELQQPNWPWFPQLELYWATLSGNVTDSNGSSIDRAKVIYENTDLSSHTSSLWVESDQAGDYSVIVEKGQWIYVPPSSGHMDDDVITVHIYRPPFQFNSRQVTIYKDEDEIIHDITANPDNIYIISGIVKNPHGNPVEGVTISGFPIGNITTDGNGDFRDFVLEGWDETLTPSLGSNQFIPESITFNPVDEDVSNIEFVMAPIKVTGTVTIDGSPAEGFEIGAFESGSEHPTFMATTNALGEYALAISEDWTGSVKPILDLYYNNSTPSSYPVPAGSYENRDFSINHEPTIWIDDGLPINITSGIDHQNVQIASDGQDGAIIIWEDKRSPSGDLNIYAQHISYSGDRLWIDDVAIDVAICEASEKQFNSKIMSDGSKGAIIVWEDQRNGSAVDAEIYAQWIDANGVSLWPENGILIGQGHTPMIVSDGSGGAIIIWLEGLTVHVDCIYAQHIDSNGQVDPNWQSGGVLIQQNLNGIGIYTGWQDPGAVPDGSSGAIVAWLNTYDEVWAQRVNANGIPQWPNPSSTAGIQVKPDPGNLRQQFPAIATDGAGGAFIVWWQLMEVPPAYYLQAYRLGPAGTAPVPWDDDNIYIDDRGDLSYMEVYPKIVSDGQGGFISVWRNTHHIWTQRLDGNGIEKWGELPPLSAQHDLRLSNSIYNDHFQLSSDGFGGANYVINDLDNGLYVQKVTASAGKPLGASGLDIGDNAEMDAFDFTDEQLQIISDNQGRPLFTWIGQGSSLHGVYAHKVDEAGTATIEAYARKSLDGSEIPMPEFAAQGCPAGLTCSKGIQDQIIIYVTLPGREVAADDITVSQTLGGNALIFETVTADGDITAPNYQTTLTISEFGGCGVDALEVRENGSPVGIVDIKVRGFDAENPNGVVDVIDFSSYSSHHTSPPKDYSECYDYAISPPGHPWQDGVIDVLDFSEFAQHYLHESTGVPPSPSSAVVTNSSISLFLAEASERDRVSITVKLLNAADAQAAVCAINYNKDVLEFVDWKAAQQFPGEVLVSVVRDEDGNRIVIAGFADGAVSRDQPVIKLNFAVPKDKSSAEVTNGVKLWRGEYLDQNGNKHVISGSEIEHETPKIFKNSLAQNHPNPFNPTTTIEYSIASNSEVNLSIFNVNGHLIRTLVNKAQKKGSYKTEWNGTDNRGNIVATGIYFYKLVTKNFSMSKKMVLLK